MTEQNKPHDEIKKVCVIGAGVMGAGIAAQAANGGADVLLLDIVPKGASDRSTIAKGAIERYKKTDPAPLMHPSFAKRITPGNTEDDLDKIKDCDWVVEVVLEDLQIKHDLYAKIIPHLKPDAILSSNTSTIPLEALSKGLPSNIKKRFFITHFFNPPRYMRLLEIVSTPDADKNSLQRIESFTDLSMGKSIIHAKDTPGFIANRIGTFWLFSAVTGAFEQNIGVEEADSVLGRPTGAPKMGVFGLIDLVGLDLMPHVMKSMVASLPKTDELMKLGNQPELLQKMIDDGYTGRKGKGGFYRLNTDGGKKTKEVINLATGEYSKALRPTPPATKASQKAKKSESLRALLSHESAEGKYAWSVLGKTLAYAASLVPEISDDIERVDRAMRLGYNWKWGPFELIDKIGPAWFVQKLEQSGMDVPPLLNAVGDGKFYKVIDGKLSQFDGGGYEQIVHPQGTLLLSDIKLNSKPIFSNVSASVWDIGDKVACLEFHSKMNSINPFTLMMAAKAVNELPKKGFKALVIYNEGSNFSVGANIGLFLVVAKLHVWPVLRWILSHGQKTMAKIKFSQIPVVGAPSGMALGGGCETLLHCDKLVAHSETYVGLVEVGVGIIPGWGGCKELIGRWFVSKNRPGGPMAPVMKSFETVATAKVAKSAFEARDLMFLRPGDEIIMNRDRVLSKAKDAALKMADNYAVPEPYEVSLPGPSGRAALEMALRDFSNKGMATPHDVTIGKELAWVLSGGNTDITETLNENKLLGLERKGFMRLAKNKKSVARVEHMLKKGKPLRN
ncbi:MAG: 3-hydroxyacyl-CoA dehydrogenase NAD-binding domain-containing protein [Rhodospirillaceae bacterium]|nr:3-hydroxyacyl-CoA dehydrogenase NAD-binding domain-containing protein [Rhodospirillaceae bacterium]